MGKQSCRTILFSTRLYDGDCSSFDVCGSQSIRASIQMSPECLGQVLPAAFCALNPALLQSPGMGLKHRYSQKPIPKPGLWTPSRDKAFTVKTTADLLCSLQFWQFLNYNPYNCCHKKHNLFTSKNDQAYQVREDLVFLNRTLSCSSFSHSLISI